MEVEGRERRAHHALQQRACSARRPSCWSRSKFTMDADMSRAVTEAFVPLARAEGPHVPRDAPHQLVPGVHDRAERSRGRQRRRRQRRDLRVRIPRRRRRRDRRRHDAARDYARRHRRRGSSRRPAVHPALHGKRVRHPFVDRTFPIITDAILVDPKFGTGAVKVTPAHDFNDFATGKRHGLEEINILNLDGTLNANAGPFAGKDRKEARRAVKRALEERGLARGSKPHTLTLPRCQRSGGVVEPMISTQWFLKMEGMAKSALGLRRRALGQDGHRPRRVGEDIQPLPREHSRLEVASRAPAVVGAPDPRVAQHDHGRREGRARAARPSARPAEVESRIPTCSTRGFRARSAADVDGRVARRHRRVTRSSTPRAISRRATTSSSSGSPTCMMMFRAPLHGRSALPPRAPLRPHRRRDRREDGKVEGKRHRPSRSRQRKHVRGDGEEDAARRSRG